ncbi:phosphate ABC transporter substrate-binding protein [Streptomyces sp. 8K308]|nr:phosphate ABC transporter substrate-binding protein [Streptomyces sp. 8K308]
MGLVTAVLGILVPVGAALYEFVLFGRKRLGYRVQMDTPVTDELHSDLAGPLQQLKIDDRDLDQPSVVLMRIENAGSAAIHSDDYASLPGDLIGLRVSFPERRVCGVAVTEFHDDDNHLRHCFGPDSGLGVGDGVIQLPKAPLNQGNHYKVLAVLEREPGAPQRSEPPKPRVEGGIIGGVRRRRDHGRVQQTESNTTGLSRRWSIALFIFVFVVSVTQLGLALNEDGAAAPLDCAEGELTLVGSTAFEPVLTEAAESYRDHCPDATIEVATEGSEEGWARLDEAAGTDMLAFSDGPKAERYTSLLPTPVALILFTLIADPDVGVEDLSLNQVRQIWGGEIDTWDADALDGAALAIRTVSRESDSGTQRAFADRVLGGWEPGDSSADCLDDDADQGRINCRVDSTGDMVNTVAQLDGAIGYAELGAAMARDDVRTIAINGQPADLDAADAGAYPFWATEYAYSYGELTPDSLAASFLRFLTEQIGEDIIRFHGHRPCDDMVNEVLCQPTLTAGPTP